MPYRRYTDDRNHKLPLNLSQYIHYRSHKLPMNLSQYDHTHIPKCHTNLSQYNWNLDLRTHAQLFLRSKARSSVQSSHLVSPHLLKKLSKTEKSWLLIDHGGGPGICALEDASTIIEWRAILGHQLSGAARRIHLCHGVRLLTEKQATLKPTPGLHATAEMRALKVGMDSHW